MIELRALRESDGAALHALWLRALQDHPESFGASLEDERQRPVADVAARLRGELSTAESYMLGAFADGALVGMVTFRRWPAAKFRHGAMLTGMYVAPELRGRGVGRRLLEEVLGRARALDGLEQIKLAVVTSNSAARALYRALGFESYGVERAGLRVAGQDYDLDWMVCRLR